MYNAAAVHDLRTLIASYHPLIVIETVEEERVTELLSDACDQLDLPMFDWSRARGLCKLPSTRAIMAKTAAPNAALQYIDNIDLRAVYLFKDLTPYLEDHGTARLLREAVSGLTKDGSSVIICGSSVKLPPELENLTAYYRLEMPTQEELNTVLDETVLALSQSHQLDVPVDEAIRSSLVTAMAGMTLNQARQSIAHAVLADHKLDTADLDRIREHKAKLIRDGGLLEFYPAKSNRFELGGFDRMKQWLNRAATGFSAQAAEWNLEPPKGILIVGVQGCGKSLAAKAIARAWSVPLLKLDAGALFDKYIGESEKNFREAVKLAESVAPCVLWIDEMEKGFSSGGGDDNDGGTSRRLLASFLTWLQEKERSVFVVGTANDIFAMPPELMRKGRFDEIFFVDLPTADERKIIFDIHLKLRNQAPEHFDVPSLVAASEGFSGSEIEQAVIASLYRALYEKRAPGADLILRELSETVPLSVSRKEDLNRLRTEAAQRFVPVT